MIMMSTVIYSNMRTCILILSNVFEFVMDLCLPAQGTDMALKELRSELQNFGSGPPAKLSEGKSTRTIVDLPPQTVATTLHDFVARFDTSIIFDYSDAPTFSSRTKHGRCLLIQSSLQHFLT